MRILVAGADTWITPMLVTLLRGYGHEVVEAATVAEAFAALDHGFRTVVCDLHALDPHGPVLMRTLRDSFGMGGIAVLLHEEYLPWRELEECGFQAMLVKLANPSQLLWALHRTLASRAAPGGAGGSLAATGLAFDDMYRRSTLIALTARWPPLKMARMRRARGCASLAHLSYKAAS